MGQVETKVFTSVPPWEAEAARQNTALEEQVVEMCWHRWRKDTRSEDGKIDLAEFVSWAEGLVQGMSEENKMGEDDLKQLFDLLDRDEDNFLEFSDVLAFIFSMSTELSDEEKRIRSFRFYDRKGNKVISKEEMFHTLRVLGDLPADVTGEDGEMPDEIENLFSLMDFARDGKISEEEFLRATGHYRRLGQLLTIQKWENVRNEMIESLTRELDQWNKREIEDEVKEETVEEEAACKSEDNEKKEKKEEKKGISRMKKWLSFDR